MKPSEAAKEIRELAADLKRLSGLDLSPELLAFLDELEVSPGLKAVRKSKTPAVGSSPKKTPRVGARPKRDTEAEMSKTIDEIAKKLKDAFNSDDGFERALTDPQVQTLSKAHVVTLYNRVFEQPRPLAKSMTKPEVLNAFRRERISRVRSGY